MSRGRSGGAKRKSSGRKTKRSAPGASKTMIVLALAVLATFAAGLYFLMHHKPGADSVPPVQTPHTGNGLPPKPEERWRYIKELENRQVGVATPTEPTAGGEIRSQTQLTDEQRQLLEQMQADMRQRPTQLSEVPYNDPAQNTGRRQPAVPVTQQPAQTPPVQNTAPRQNTAGTQSNPVQATQPSQQRQAQQQQQQQKPKPAPVTNATAQQQQTAAKPQQEKPQQEKSQKWMLQCGSFRSADQAESVRAQLAFEGIESRITSGGGWNRVLLGPYSTRAAADKMQQRLKGVGMSSCIPLATGG
ncbi:cell division protein FtsN [Enterobacillus tribolii]|uniref:Cell division protein FtsN n=1 Tax=Enterobacillus tribolii TaxID=1487935 RepID=A0A370QE94_9GAMM|nr:cell division protein FtsN [Enterobacillus tribolii]